MHFYKMFLKQNNVAFVFMLQQLEIIVTFLIMLTFRIKKKDQTIIHSIFGSIICGAQILFAIDDEYLNLIQ